jgi:uncharacterized repeat protein (TIGR03803 family)
MKSIYIFCIFLFLFQHSGTAQGIYQLYGQTPYGGIENGGIIFTTNSAGGNFQTRYDFRIGTNAGAEPWYTKLAEYNGKFYGMTLKGGLSNNGVIFEFDPVTNIYTKKIDFTGANGSLPYGSLVLSGTKFYGMTSEGGTASKGVLFEWDPVTNVYSVKYNFNLEGHTPYGNVTAVGGILYGMTRFGGVNVRGVIFQFDPSTNIYTKKIDLAAATGSYPQSSLTHSNGIFYGVTVNGGINDLGTIFQWDPVTNIYTKKFDFATSTNGNYPIGSMTEYAGKFYGMTFDGSVGGGVIYEWDPVANIYIKKLDLTPATGYKPSGEFTFLNGKFYGLTLTNNSTGGSIIEWDPATNILIKKIDLNEVRGSAASGTLLLSGTKMYGVTKAGGADLLGTLFEWDPATNIFTKRYDFGGKDDKFPTGTLTPANGKLYGACTKGGGINSIGLLFEWDPATRTYTREYSFSGPDGRNPNSSLTYFNNKFYGMTTFGGAQDSGVIFEWDPTANLYTKKIDLSAATGTLPYGDLVAYNNKLYGMTSTGNAGNTGTIFEWDPATNIIIKKIDFTGPTGYQPYGSLALFNNKFYGTTTTGGPFPNFSGTIFEWDPATNIIVKKIDFSPANGYLSYGTLRLVNNLFYGVTYFGGANGAGVLFEYDPTANTYTLKYDFLNTTGSNPQAGVTYSGGKLYGITRNGGTNNRGVIFEWNPVSNVYSKKYDFANFSPTLYYNNYLLNIPAYIGNGVVNTCSNVPPITINSSNNNIWVPITDLMGDAIGEINANGNNLGLVNVSLYVHNGPARSDGNNKFLNRNISINSANAPSSPVGIRLYIRKSEADSLIATPGSGATQISDIRLYRSSNLCQMAIPNLVDSIPSTIDNWMGGYVYNASVAGFSTFYFTSKNYLPPSCPVTITNNTILAAAASVCGIVNSTLITGSTPTGGNGSYQYEWERSIDNTNFSPISGANSKDYTAINISQTTYFRRKVLSGSCVSVSSVVTINYSPIPPTPSITAGTTTTFCVGASVILTSNAPNGNQWYKDGIAIGGATATTLNVTTSGSYTTIVTLNGCSSPASNAIVVTVNPIPPAPTITAGGAITFCQGGSVTLTSSASSGNQWYKDGVAIGGATATTLNVTTSGSYTVNVTLSSCVSVISNAIAVLVNPLPPTPTITASGNILQSSSLSGNQWFLNAAPISGANNQQYIAQSSGLYTVQVTLNGCNSISSGFNFIVTGIVNPSAWNHDVVLFPNPVNNNLYISNPGYRKLDIVIVDITGKIALRYNLNLSNGNVNMEKLAGGAYFVSITDKQKNETIYKVIIKK